MICIRCNAYLQEANEPIRCPYCKTLNQPPPQPQFKSAPDPVSKYQPKRSKYQPDLQPVIIPPAMVTKTIGLGDVIERVTRAVGIPTCNGCGQRKVILNKAIPDVYHPWRR